MKLINMIIISLLISSSIYAKEKVNLNFSNLKIKDFISLVSMETNTNILMTEKVSGNVDFVTSKEVYREDLMDLLISVLRSKNLTLIQDDEILKVVKSSSAHKQGVSFGYKNLSKSLMTTNLIKVKNKNSETVASKVRHLISEDGKLITVKESNSILITDYPKNIKKIRSIIYNITKNSSFVTKIVDIKKAEARKIKNYLVSISKKMFNSQIEDDKVDIVLNENVNGIILTGKKDNVARLEKLIKRLDIKSKLNKKIEIIELKNSNLTSVITSLKGIVDNMTFENPNMKPNISGNAEINSLIVMGEQVIVDELRDIIKELDKEKYQVYIQAKIINVYNKKAEDLGIKYGFDGASLSSTGGLYSLAANFGTGSISSMASQFINVPDNMTKGFALGAAIDFLEQNGVSKSISNPSILALNNQESSIYVGQAISMANGATNNAVSGITNSYIREDVGLTLKIKPRVSSSAKLTLEVETILENIDSLGNVETGEQPITSKQEIKTQAILRHGESIIVGGLEKIKNIEDISKVPLLGDIPIVGKSLFTSTSTMEEETSLIVVLTPFIINKSENLSTLQQNLGIVSKLQEKYNLKVFKKLTKKETNNNEGSYDFSNDEEY